MDYPGPAKYKAFIDILSFCTGFGVVVITYRVPMPYVGLLPLIISPINIFLLVGNTKLLWRRIISLHFRFG